MRSSHFAFALLLVGGCDGANGGAPGGKDIELISSDFTLAPGTEQYQCQRLTIPSDTYLVSITPDSPPGVHHEVLAIDPSGRYPDGLTIQPAGKAMDPACPAIGANWTPLFAAGLGSPSLAMPANVALKVSAGQQIVFNLHLFNATASASSGTATLHVSTATDATGYQIAGVPFVGAIDFTIPAAGGQVNGSCTIANDTTYFAVFPHMHLDGTHMKVWTTGANAQTVWDEDYDFREQKFGTFSGIPLHTGDTIQNTCTYGPSSTGMPISFGESTDNEMCFAISYVVPMIQTPFGVFCGTVH